MESKCAELFFELSLNLLGTIDSKTNMFVTLNPTWEKMLGWSIEELTSRPFLEFVHPDDQHATLTAINKLTTEEDVDSLRFKNRYSNKNGSWTWLTWKVSLRDGMHYAVAQDITYQEQLQTHLTETNQELARFTYAASHDLQEPLRKLVSFSVLLEEDAGDALPEAAKEDLDYIIDAAMRMRAMIKALLGLSRSSRQNLKIMPTTLDTCLANAIDDLSLILDSSDADITFDTLPMVLGDAESLRCLFVHLLSNALKFVEEGQKVHIHIGAERQDNNMWVISVADNGIGFDMKYATQIFKAFRRLNSRDKYEGPGVGLTLCETLVHRHEGKIWAKSNLDKGSTFYFSLPAISSHTN